MRLPKWSMIAFNLLRAARTIASRFHAKATTGTIRAQLIRPDQVSLAVASRVLAHRLGSSS